MMDSAIRSQILEVRGTGLTNMFDTGAVQRIASERGLQELVCWLEDNKAEYVSFTLHGDKEI